MKLRKLPLLMIHFFLFGEVLLAQQDGHFSLYRHHMTIFNPAVTGLSDFSFVNLSYKSQWTGVQGAPETQVISFGTPLSRERGGVGFNVINDATFVERQTLFFVSFSYKLSLNESSDLFLGLQAGGNSFQVNGTALETIGDNFGAQIDPLLYDHSQFNPNVGVGFYLRTKNAFVSLSAPKILNTKRFVEEEGFFTAAADRVHYYLSAGRRFDVSENWTLTPYFMSRFVNAAPIFTSFNAALSNNNGLEMGVEYNMDSSLGGNLILDLGGISFGYAYSRSVHSEINQNTVGSHEFLLKINLGSGSRIRQSLRAETVLNQNTDTENNNLINTFASR